MTNVLEWLEKTLETQQDGSKPAFFGESGSLSYGELWRQAQSVGSFLLEAGVTKKPVAVFMEKSPEAVAAFFGAVYAGNYYVPLDAEMPAARISAILEMLAPPVVICDESAKNTVKQWGQAAEFDIWAYDSIKDTPIQGEMLRLAREKAIDCDPLYVVFTSGSTGIPKGVVASHRNVIDYIGNLSQVLQTDRETVFGIQSPFYLDACLKEIYGAIAQGGAAVIVPRRLFMFPVSLLEYLAENGANTICWVSSALGFVAGIGALGKARLPDLRTVAFGGETIKNEHLNEWMAAFPAARFVHLYGPTEATGMSAYHVVEKPLKKGERLPIGRPFGNTDIILLDDEICIRGAGLALGYFGDEERTRESFAQNPRSSFPDRLYKTGDIGRMGDDGLLYFAGRRDSQVKHMGYRVELSEIERAAGEAEGVAGSACVYDEERGRLALFCAGSESPILQQLKKSLPRHMLPQKIIWLDALPTLHGGKIDRQELKRRFCEEA